MKTAERKYPRKRREKVQDVPPAEYVLDFGEHKGKMLKDIPLHYLEWIVSNVTNRPLTVETVKKFLSTLPAPIPAVAPQAVVVSPSPAPDRSALRKLQNHVQPIPPNDLVSIAHKIVYGLKKVRERLEEEYAVIAALTVEDLEAILSDAKFNADYKEHCSKWRHVQELLDDLDGKGFEHQQKGLAQIKSLID
jgi:hypothetical protein